MTENSNIRRIDDLGRIVIPKDIRKKLHISDGEPLEIFIENGEIHIKKYSSLPDVIEYIEYLIDTASRITNNKFIVTDREKIIASSENRFKEKELDKFLKNEVLTCKEEKGKKVEIKLDSETLEAYVNIMPIIIDTDRAGLLMEYNDEREVAPSDISKMIKNLIEKQLNNY